MRFSLAYNLDLQPGSSHAEQYRVVERLAVAADLLGFDAIWLVERPALASYRLPASLPYLRSLVTMTRRIALGAIITISPNYFACRLANEIALLETLSGGRVRLGLDLEEPTSFVMAGTLNSVTPRAHATATSMLAVIEKLRQDMQCSVVERLADVPYARELVRKWRAGPEALQPLWLLAGAIPPEMAATHGYPYIIPKQDTPEQQRDLIRRYRQTTVGGTGFIAHHSTIIVTATERELRAQRLDLPPHAPAIVGTPQEVVDKLITWQLTTDFDEVICQVSVAGMQPDAALHSIELLGKEVLPHLQPPLRVAVDAVSNQPRGAARCPPQVTSSRSAVRAIEDRCFAPDHHLADLA